MALIISNVDPVVEQQDIHGLFDCYGTAQSITRLSPTSWKIVYHSYQKALSMITKLDEHKLHGTRISVVLEPSQGVINVKGADSITRKNLEDAFGRYGRIGGIVPVSRGKWEIRYEDIRDANDAKNNLNGCQLNGKDISVEGPSRIEKQTTVSASIYVSNVPPTVRSEDLRNVFERYGVVGEIEEEVSGGWTIEYKDGRNVIAARRMDGCDIGGRCISVQADISQLPHSGQPSMSKPSASSGYLELTIAGTFHSSSGEVVTLVPTQVNIPIKPSM